ncbi:MAG: hypothetical protein ABFQ53_03265 [Patescibacteria group bacterium]
MQRLSAAIVALSLFGIILFFSFSLPGPEKPAGSRSLSKCVTQESLVGNEPWSMKIEYFFQNPEDAIEFENLLTSLGKTGWTPNCSPLMPANTKAYIYVNKDKKVSLKMYSKPSFFYKMMSEYDPGELITITSISPMISLGVVGAKTQFFGKKMEKKIKKFFEL